ncbi:hypothetical protein T484DRAFT_1792955, partial [Baffinella frigidus]
MEDFLLTNNIAPDDTTSKYILALYFINTVVTTVGFGDIRGTNAQEQVFCIIVMWIGTIVFAIVVSEASDIIAKANARNNALKEKHQDVRKLLQGNNCDKALTDEILS